jgi:hypothetical protein
MAMCAELADLAMHLARIAAARALAQSAEPTPTPAAEPQSLPTPEPQTLPAPAPQTLQAPPPPSRHPAEPPAARETAPRAYAARAASLKPIDPALLFTRLAAIVRHCITLEARLAATLASPPAKTRRIQAGDPRRAPLREILHLATVNHPNRAALRQEITTRLEEHLAGDPDQTINPTEILDAICDEFAVQLDLANLSDDSLHAVCGTQEGPEDNPHPRATSPP